MKPLLEKAVEVIPKEKQSLTRLSLKATAGLRMISDELADKILAKVNKDEFLFVKYWLILNLFFHLKD